jgi:hypothetical protein
MFGEKGKSREENVEENDRGRESLAIFWCGLVENILWYIVVEIVVLLQLVPLVVEGHKSHLQILKASRWVSRVKSRFEE